MESQGESAGRVVEVGDFFEESWGYDQTNVDFYQVVKVSSSGKSVWLRHVQCSLVRSEGHHDYVAPVPDGFDDNHCTESRAGVLTKRLRRFTYDGQDHFSVNMTSYSDAYLWDCKPAYQTAIGWGH